MDNDYVGRESAKILPPGLHIYDFGPPQTVMPKPDFMKKGSYLTSHIFFLHDDNNRFTATEIYQCTDAALLAALPRAIARFEKDAKQLKPGETPDAAIQTLRQR